uniref:ATP-binding protein n=1 Tax=candidate division WOR-3 bacterium TaxID=2052148 RepID=A0A7C3Z312_UNCW3
MRRGLVCSHPVFGEGEVLEERFRGQEFLVKFKTGLRLWLRRERLFFLQEVGEEKIDLIAARRMVEAFRLGIVPRRDIENFTFGREKEISLLKREIEKLKMGEGTSFLLEGEYGSGKTHLLEYLYHLGLKEGIVTSRVELDPREVSLARPKKVYREIIHNLRFLTGEKEGGFRDLLRNATRLDLKDHIYFSPLLACLRRIEDERQTGEKLPFAAEVFWQWVEGESTKEYAAKNPLHRIRGGYKIPALYDFSTAVDFYCYLLSGISYIARALGHFGLLLLLDEAETIAHSWERQDFRIGITFLEGLVGTSQNMSELKRINPHHLHNGMRPTPYIYKNSHLLLIIASTPLPNEYTYLRIRHLIKNGITLSPLSDRAKEECFENLFFIYHSAYPDFSLPPLKKQEIFLSALQRENLRDFIKFIIDYLDCERLSSSTYRHTLRHRPSLSP